MAEFTFRPAAADEVRGVAALVHSAYRHYIPLIGGKPGPMEADYDEVIRARSVVLAVDDDLIVGLIVMHDQPGDFVLENLAVEPACQFSGLGSALLEHAESAARQAGHDTIRLYTHRLMTENLAFYRKRGYVEYANPEGPDFLTHLRKDLR